MADLCLQQHLRQMEHDNPIQFFRRSLSCQTVKSLKLFRKADPPSTATLGFFEEGAEVGRACRPACTTPSNVTP